MNWNADDEEEKTTSYKWIWWKLEKYVSGDDELQTYLLDV